MEFRPDLREREKTTERAVGLEPSEHVGENTPVPGGRDPHRSDLSAGKDVTRAASYELQGFITFPRPRPSLLLADTLARMSNTGLWHSQALGLPDLTVSLLRAQH